MQHQHRHMYADLAERYEADIPVEPGEVVMLGGHAEITKCNKELCDACFWCSK